MPAFKIKQRIFLGNLNAGIKPAPTKPRKVILYVVEFNYCLVRRI